eukprot:TRINITY_DN8370_c0_g1_i3.p3 TRINITY_DN8370_c0_g1~~TRINITY_DN8370_c0_g1_i3.p3  ORF type:complete len:104 (+),score=14.47 TRINITY_DN8370_c0_g1_i3:840-1151(+)
MLSVVISAAQGRQISWIRGFLRVSWNQGFLIGSPRQTIWQRFYSAMLRMCKVYSSSGHAADGGARQLVPLSSHFQREGAMQPYQNLNHYVFLLQYNRILLVKM